MDERASSPCVYITLRNLKVGNAIWSKQFSAVIFFWLSEVTGNQEAHSNENIHCAALVTHLLRLK